MKRPNFNRNANSVNVNKEQLLKNNFSTEKVENTSQHNRLSEKNNHIDIKDSSKILEETNVSHKSKFSNLTSRIKYLRKISKPEELLKDKKYNARTGREEENFENDVVSDRKESFVKNIRRIKTVHENSVSGVGKTNRFSRNRRNRSRKTQNTASSPIKNNSSRRFTVFKETSFKVTQKGSSNILLTLLAILLVLGACLVFMSPTLKALISQSQEYNHLENQIVQTQKINEDLKTKLQELNEEKYVADQARQRLGYVRQGETTYVVIDPEVVTNKKNDEEKDQVAPRKPWFDLIQDSIKVIEETKTFVNEKSSTDGKKQ